MGILDGPRTALARAIAPAGGMQASTSGASEPATRSRFRVYQAGKRVTARDEDHELGGLQRQRSQQELRFMRRNLGIVFGALNRFSNGVVGTGLFPMPMTVDKDWNRDVAQWARRVMLSKKLMDSRKRLTHPQMQQLVVKARMAEGGCGFVKVDSGALQPIEAERVQTPTKMSIAQRKDVVNGIRLSPDGEPLEVYICRRNGSGLVDRNVFDAVDWDDFIYPTVVERFDQLHTVPCLHAITDILKDRGDYVSALIWRARLEAWQGWQIRSTDPEMTAENMAKRDSDGNVEETDKGLAIVSHEKGEFWVTDDRTDIDRMGIDTPGNNTDPFLKMIMRDVGMSIDVPWQVLMLELERPSFSGARAIFALAEYTWEIWREWLVQEYLQPWWNWRVALALDRREIPPAPVVNGVSQWDRVAWMPPRRAILNDQDQANANKSNVSLGQISPQMLAFQAGTDLERVEHDKQEAIERAVSLANDINKRHPGAGVHWRDFYDWGVPGAIPPEVDADTAASLREGGIDE